MSDGPGRERQRDVYIRGAAGETPDVPPSYEKLRDAAREEMTDEAYGYVEGGAGSGDTALGNRRAFERRSIEPRVMRDVSERDLSTRVLGDELSAPFLLAPVGVLSIVHDDADTGMARAAASLDVPFTVSTVSSDTLEDIAEEADETHEDGDATRWFQLYPSSDAALNRSLVERAENAGYSAVVITVDTPLLGWRERDIENGYLPFLDGEGLANYFSDPVFRGSLDTPPEENEFGAIQRFIDVFSDATLTPPDISEIADYTNLPVVVKGVLRPEDARRAVEVGADGVVVSNHGGRQVDGAVAALDALPRVAEAVDDATVLFDSGVRRGADALKALALGADAVMLGRPYVYGLALDGEDGVREVVENFRADFDLTLGLTGLRSVDEVGESVLRRSE